MREEEEEITLSPELSLVAREELGETPILRRKCLKDFREWIDSQTHFRNLRTDSNFLLRFLRFSKFKLPGAISSLERYAETRVKNPEWFANLDVREERLKDLISRGYLFLLPEKDESKRSVVYSKASSMDASKFTSTDVIRVHILLFESLLEDPENQIRGLSYILDERDTNWSHISVWTPNEITKAFSCTEKSLPIRHRSIHLVHLPWTLMIVFHFAKSLLSHKLRKRFNLHASFEELTKDRIYFKESILPSECGMSSNVSMDKMIATCILKLDQVRDKVLKLDEIQCDS